MPYPATGQSGTLFSNTQAPNLFGQPQHQQTGLFGATNTNINGTTVKYQPVSGTDTIQKNNIAVQVQTKLNCISAMKEYELKCLEELRFEDYLSNRTGPQKSMTTGMFGGNQSSTLFNNPSSMFQPNTPFGTTQQPTLGANTQNNLFGATNQTNTFGSKNLFAGGTATSTNSAFGTFNQQKSATLFGMNTSTANKPIFGGAQSTQSTSLFGTTQQNASPIFGTQTQPQQTTLFGGLNQQNQQPQQTGLFNTNTSTSQFGFQPPQSTGLFGVNNAAKPFAGATSTGSTFAFSTSSTPASTSLFGTPAQTGGIFGTNTTNTAFGNAAKPGMFNNTAFNTTPNNTVQSSFTTNTGFDQTNIFNNQNKTNPSPFGTANVMNNANKPALFGAGTPQTGSIFGNTAQSSFATAGNPSPFNTAAATANVPVANNTFLIGVTTPAEAAHQQQLMQQKILSLVSNRPYGVNKLFLGRQQLNGADSPITTVATDAGNANNLQSLVTKRNDADKSTNNQRRRMLNHKTKLVPNQLHKVFSGFDEEEDLSTKASPVDNFFFTKREDWKYLPPAAFEKSRKSMSVLNASTHSNGGNVKSIYPSLTHSFLRDANRSQCSTPLVDNAVRKAEAVQTSSPLMASPMRFASPQQRDSVTNSNEGEFSIGHTKEEFLTVNNDNSGHNDSADEAEESVDGCGERCKVKLSKGGYYTAPRLDILDRLVSVGDNGEKECWVENFIVGRNDYGSVRFPGQTNVYGLCLDDLVMIERKEVSVYPDDSDKPDEGEGLNKLAQVILTQVWPMNKSSGELIRAADQLVAMHFEEKLRRSTERLGAKFVSYTANNGVWVFEVEHFSKYTFLDTDSEDEDEQQPILANEQQKTSGEQARRLAPPVVTRNVVVAEADSMTRSVAGRGARGSVFDKLLDPSGARNVMKMKQAFYHDDSDEEMLGDHRGSMGAADASMMFFKNEAKGEWGYGVVMEL